MTTENKAANAVTFVISDLGAGGAQRVATTLASHLFDQGHDVSFVTLAGKDTDFFALPGAMVRISLDQIDNSNSAGKAIAANVKRVLRLRKAIRTIGAGTVVSFVGSTNILTILATAGLGTRVVISERNDPARQSLGRIWDLLRKAIYRFADVVTANSQGALDTMRAYVPIRKLALVRNPLAMPNTETTGHTTEHRVFQSPTVLSVGRLTRQKGYDVLLRAFAQLNGRANWRLAIAGDGELREELGAFAENLGIAQQTYWMGAVKDPFTLYREAEFMVLASRFEGVPNVLLEAMVCGLPAIITNGSPGPLEYVEDGHNGIIVDADDHAALAAAMASLMDSRDLRRRLGAAAGKSLTKSNADAAIATWKNALSLPVHHHVDGVSV
jgi:GalNAc-alpha-(1->4)-GalNAc-alpha-(1->3)-diNAcBac-PP-undecaprenol alpha-1,4-N-acetyl-D-galactosaminyltransferase